MKRLLQAAALCAALLLTLSTLMAPPSAAATPRQWEFQVFLDDSPIGYHRYMLHESGAERELKIEARFNVKVLFINVYRYAHDNSERWRGDCLAALNARTDDNGKVSEVGAELQGERLAVATSVAATRAREMVEGCLMSFAYWNPNILRQTRLLNAQTGKVESVSITALGEEKINVRGMPVAATRYRIAGAKHPIDLWYGADRSWLALQSTFDSGRRLRYELK